MTINLFSVFSSLVLETKTLQCTVVLLIVYIFLFRIFPLLIIVLKAFEFEHSARKLNLLLK